MLLIGYTRCYWPSGRGWQQRRRRRKGTLASRLKQPLGLCCFKDKMSFVFLCLLACLLPSSVSNQKRSDGEVKVTGEGTLRDAYLKSTCSLLSAILDVSNCKMKKICHLENGVIYMVQTFIEYPTN